MSETSFSYRPILEEMTEVVNDRQLDPYEAYEWLYTRELQDGLVAESYLSSSITSGGHARDTGLDMRQVIARNTESAKILAEQLAHDRQIQPNTAIEPVFVGKTRWNQAEFMEFWLSVIGGYEIRKGFTANSIDGLRSRVTSSFNEVELNKELMVSKESAEVRAAEYFKMSTAFARLITSGLEANPIRTVVRMIDTDTSLGAQTERAFARLIGSKVMNVSITKGASPAEIEQVNPVLAHDTERLISFGATIFDTSSQQVRLQLVEEYVA